MNNLSHIKHKNVFEGMKIIKENYRIGEEAIISLDEIKTIEKEKTNSFFRWTGNKKEDNDLDNNYLIFYSLIVVIRFFIKDR